MTRYLPRHGLMDATRTARSAKRQTHPLLSALTEAPSNYGNGLALPFCEWMGYLIRRFGLIARSSSAT
jgi:hypothetical protein